MPSSAFTGHLSQLLEDAAELQEAHTQLKTGKPGRQYGLAALNRAAVVLSVSAWESYVEELMRECLQILRPAAPPLGAWPALSAHVLGLLARFHTPNAVNVAALIHQSLGLPDIHHSWTWARCTSAQAVQRLHDVLNYRHQIAHGVNPRPAVHNEYARSLPLFFRRLAGCTDGAVRHHLINALGVANPWPP